MAHKYLEELRGYEPLFTDEELENDSRNERWRKQTEIYGFNDTETWDMDRTFYLWLYEHLRMYEEVASDIVDLNYHKFSFKGKKYTQLELIHLIMDKIKFYFSTEYDDFDGSHYNKIKEIGEIWAMLLPSMWW